MVHPLREWYLPPTVLNPPQTHHLLAQRNLACLSPVPGIGIHTCQTYSPTITTPHSSHKDLPNKDSIEFKIYQQGRVELSSLKKRERRPLSIPKRVANHGVQINPSGKPSTSFPQTFQIFHVWLSADPVVDHSLAGQYR